jgi:hypothetical protein
VAREPGHARLRIRHGIRFGLLSLVSNDPPETHLRSFRLSAGPVKVCAAAHANA